MTQSSLLFHFFSFSASLISVLLGMEWIKILSFFLLVYTIEKNIAGLTDTPGKGWQTPM